MIIEKLLKDTKFKKDAVEIARQLAKVGITDLTLLADAPGRLRSVRVWDHPLSEVIAAIREAAEKAEKERSAPAEDKPKDKQETPTSEPPKAVGGTK